MACDGPNLTIQKSRTLGVFDRKLEGSHSPLYYYFDNYLRKWNKNDQLMIVIFIDMN